VINKKGRDVAILFESPEEFYDLVLSAVEEVAEKYQSKSNYWPVC